VDGIATTARGGLGFERCGVGESQEKEEGCGAAQGTGLRF